MSILPNKLHKLLPTSLVGSYPQPDWLIDRLDIVTDGETRRESYSNRFATALDGIDLEKPGTTINRSGEPIAVPRVVAKIRRRHPVEVRDAQFLRANTDRTIKMTVPGPFTMAQQCQDDFYRDEELLALDYAAAVNEEIRDLFAAGVDVVQIDEPWMQARPDRARRYGVAALNRALEAIEGVYARASKLKNLRLRGIQMHIGSQLTEVKPFDLSVNKLSPLASLSVETCCGCGFKPRRTTSHCGRLRNSNVSLQRGWQRMQGVLHRPAAFYG